jgi:FKBP-type peptidyl-prolyl cis-trans isomerase 2
LDERLQRWATARSSAAWASTYGMRQIIQEDGNAVRFDFNHPLAGGSAQKM